MKKIQLSGDSKRHGVVSLAGDSSFPEAIREPYFALNIYRVMGDRSLLTIARDEPFQVVERPDGMTLTWQSTATLPVDMEAIYTVDGDHNVELAVHIRAARPITRFEVSVSSYFNFNYEPYGIISIRQPGQSPAMVPALWKADDQPFIRGSYIYLPRDDDAIATRVDGRWNDPLTGKSIGSAVFGAHYGAPVALMKLNQQEQELYIAQVASQASCSGITLTYASSNERDVIREHNATYFTLFGEDLDNGEERSAIIRQTLCRGLESLRTIIPTL